MMHAGGRGSGRGGGRGNAGGGRRGGGGGGTNYRGRGRGRGGTNYDYDERGSRDTDLNRSSWSRGNSNNGTDQRGGNWRANSSSGEGSFSRPWGNNNGADQRVPSSGGGATRTAWQNVGNSLAHNSGEGSSSGPWGKSNSADQRDPSSGGGATRTAWQNVGNSSAHNSGEGSSSGPWGKSNSADQRDPSSGGGGATRTAWQNVSISSEKSVESVNITSPPISEFRSLGISQSLQKSPQSEGSKRIPIGRPDNGGKSAQRVRILVNHFRVKFNPGLTIYHYDVDIKPDKPASKGANVAISKSVLRMIKNKFFSESSIANTAYDGEKSVFSAVKLPAGTYKVQLQMREGLCSYALTIKLANELNLHNLEDYLKGSLSSIPREILQGMDLVMKEQPASELMAIGRNFFLQGGYNVDLQCGVVASRGFQHTLKPTSQGVALCVDYSVLSFLKPNPVLDYVSMSLNLKHNEGKSYNYYERENVLEALKGLKVMVTHRKSKQKYMVVGLTTDTCNNIKFTFNDPEGKKEVRLVDYFKEKYGLEIRYKNLPCLDFSKSRDKQNYVPMEFCILVEGQIYPKDDLKGFYAKHFRSICLANPSERMKIIQGMVKESNGPCGGKIAEAFEIEVNTSMTEVTGHVIEPPDLKLGDENGRVKRLTSEKCQWNLTNQTLVEGKEIRCWGILDFSSSDRYKLDRNKFVSQLMNRCRRLGIKMNQERFCKQSNMKVLSDPNGLRNLLESIKNDNNVCGRLDILICVMTRKDPGYKNLKRISETEVGILTQCCLVDHANKASDQYLGNLALKINAKLGGSNMELINRLPGLEGNGHVMFIGADVNHPSAHNVSSPSIVAVVATMNWPAANKYVSRIRAQQHRQEKIENFGEICLELINTYTRLNKARPEKIVVFRDGVSDNQFDMVLNEELNDLQMVINSSVYRPKITVVVAQKRHQTRLFLKDDNKHENTTSGNVCPGTVVDTIIVHPHEFDFYLCSHYGSLGTSKSTHYYVIYDDKGFTSDELQKLIYYLCYTFARCTKPVSLVPPVYYADLAAYRGRLYYEASMESTTASSSSADHETFMLHADLADAMFFC